MEKDKIFGEIIGNVYETWRYNDEKKHHFFRKYQGFGISKKVLEHLNLAGVKIVRIIFMGAKKTIYVTPLESFINSNKKWTFEDKFNRFGGQPDEQLFVSAKDMQVVENE